MTFDKTKSHKKLNRIDIRINNIEETLTFTLWIGLIIGVFTLLLSVFSDFMTTMPLSFGWRQITGIIGSIVIIMYCVAMLRRLK